MVLETPRAETIEQPGVLAFMVRGLRYRNFRLFFCGQIVSLLGTWLTLVATSWLVYRLAQNDPALSVRAPFWLGVVGFAAQIPIFFVSPFAGVFVDRWNRHRILIATQTASMVQSFVLAALTLTGVITIWQIILLNLLQGIINAFDMPTRQSFVIQLVDHPRDLGNAIALNSSMVQAARLLGPAVAGFLIYEVGEGVCFAIDGFSFLAVLVALLRMRIARRMSSAAESHPLAAFLEGLRYAGRSRPIRALLTMVAVTSLMTMSQSTLMPVIADRVYSGGERTLGILLASAGCGALLGSLYLAARRTILGLGRVIATSACVLGLAIILFAASRHLLMALPLLVTAGACMVLLVAACNTVLQTIVDDDKRGRIMSLFAMAFMGMSPFGSLLAGSLATAAGAPRTLLLSGTVCLAAGIVFSLRLEDLRKMIRPIYRERGILPEIAAGIQSTGGAATLRQE